MNHEFAEGTLPTVWIPSGPLRDLQELTRTRLKNRLSATLAEYGVPLRVQLVGLVGQPHHQLRFQRMYQQRPTL
jgi:hypothetical protein